MKLAFATDRVSAKDWQGLHNSEEFFYSLERDVVGHNCIDPQHLGVISRDKQPSVIMARCHHFRAGFARVSECLECRARLSVIPRVPKYFPDGLIEIFSEPDEVNNCYKQKRILAGSDSSGSTKV